MSDLLKLAINSLPVRTPASRPAKTDKQEAADTQSYYPKRRARTNFIPDSEELAHLINQALNALAKGVYWDRGSIVNIVL